MGWIIKVGSASFGRSMNAGVITSNCSITSTPCQTVAQLRFTPNAGRITSGKSGSNPVCQAEQVWRNVLSILVGI